MSIKDIDLRDALEPLAGDPVTDAARVLSELPRPGIRGLAWWLLGVGLLLGGLGGYLVGRAFVEAPVVEAPGGDDREEKDDAAKMPMTPPHDIMFFGLGNVSVVEPDHETSTLRGEYGLPFGSKFDTGADAQAGMWLTGEVLVRMDLDTELSIPEAHRFELGKGRIWVHNANGGEMVVVNTPTGIVDIVGGAAIVEHADDTVRVVCLAGEATIRRTGVEALVAREGQIAAIGATGREAPTDAGFLPRHTSWMTRMLVLQHDPTEIEKRAKRMVEFYFAGEFRDEATREIRRMGGAGVPFLVQNVTERTDLDPGFVRQTAVLIAAIADVSNLPNLFTLLYHLDPEVRVTAYTRIYDMTGENHGTGDSFWRDADRQEREQAIGEWWKRVK